MRLEVNLCKQVGDSLVRLLHEITHDHQRRFATVKVVDVWLTAVERTFQADIH